MPPMQIVSYLPPHLAPRVADAVQAVGARYHSMESWASVEQSVAQRPVDILVVDPCTHNQLWVRHINRLMRARPDLTIIGYTRVAPTPLRVSTLLARRGLDDLVLFQYDDGQARLGRLFIRASMRTLVRQILAGLDDARAELPSDLSAAVAHILEHPEQYTSARDLVPQSGVPLTSLYRAFYVAGFHPPRNLFMAARVLHAYALLRDRSHAVQDVAAQLRYRHPRVMTQHTLSILGKRPSELRTLNDTSYLATRLVRWILRD